MKSLILSTVCLSSLTLAQGFPPAVTTETIYSCAANATEYLTLTVALVANSTATEEIPVSTTSTEVVNQPVPTTTTDVVFHPMTIVQTVTTTIYNISTVIPPPVTQTSTTTTSISETLYPIITIWTTTEEVTSLTICPTRTLNPTYTAHFPLPTEYTWGCPPGYLCRPDQINCNFEAGLPAENFYCSPDQCIAASALGVPQEWDTSIYNDSSPATDPSLQITPVDHYFNMNPEDYGLTYNIFVVDETFTFTSTVGYAPTPVVAARQAQTSIPGTCYPWCNDCLLEAQSVGKTPALCDPNSTYEKDLANCQQCVAYHKTDTSGAFVQIAPQFQQFMDYCAALSAPPPSPTPPVTIYSTLTVQPDLSASSTITYSTTSTSRESGASSTTKSSFTTTITSPVVSPAGSATSSSTEWLVPSSSITITFHSSPLVTTQWTMTSNSATFTFASSPVISASVVLDGTSTVALLTTSTTSGTTSSALSFAIVMPTSGSTASSGVSATSPAQATFTGAASTKGRLKSGSSLSSAFFAMVFMAVGGW